MALVNTSLITVGVGWGIGRHYYYLTDVERFMATKYEYLAQPPGVMAPAIARSAFALYILKFVGSSTWMKWTLWQTIVVQMVLCGFGTVIIIVAQCQHFNRLWDPTAGGTCWSPNVQVMAGYIAGGTLHFKLGIYGIPDTNSHQFASRSHPDLPTHGHHEKSQDEATNQDRPLRAHGNEYFVRSLP